MTDPDTTLAEVRGAIVLAIRHAARLSATDQTPETLADSILAGVELLTPARAAELRAEGAEAAHGHHTQHLYLSTACTHGRHDYCAAETGHTGTKRPASCKFCEARCICSCHTTSEETHG